MTVLVVDDHISVVSGLIFGIDWRKIGITKVLKAYNATEARKIISSQNIDILLCDIEMPVEDGLSLFTWVKEKDYPMECIFLTSHADFIYAKEALRLGSFDYILQPARYEEIERTLVKAMDKIRITRKKEEMASCGDLIQKRKNIFLDAVLQRFFGETGLPQEQAIKDLNNLGIPLNETERTFVIHLHMQKESPIVKDWENDLIKYTIENILDELLSGYGYGILIFTKSRRNFVIYVYKKEPCNIEKEIVGTQLKHFIEIYKEYSGCEMTCYLVSCNGIRELKSAVDKLEQIKSNNVIQDKGIIDGDLERQTQSAGEETKIFFEKLGTLIENNLYEKICDDAMLLLDELSGEKQMNADSLIRFYQDFLGVMYLSAEKYGISSSEIFEGETERERSLKAYSSVEEMKWLIKYITAFFNEKSASEEKQKTQIDYILQYIRSNIESDIRRTDIAEAVHLNPNYVSRLFKNETGKSLKEYIMEEKMELARELVRNTNLSISVITMKVGYNNFSYFAQVYKKVNGLPPAEDREINGKHK
ncbi:response regulator transcription factor [Anaerocolumna sp. MB42-C2]|uniref:response regulator transcription factor n=1 Tax=Anaerocolumna sp. MB42-C2 TaxID=3070997 RepID=UPI0027E1FFEE|nr:response regulator [Anaerocolumna sp. MB42-C2]WMJ89557.1 response regulator [Anaerocolumna sp. MB42-C2]